MKNNLLNKTTANIQNSNVSRLKILKANMAAA